ncbi:MAG: hypothetical protein II080_08945, partial [Lachnospiraceae bacterium]|nr:hypothetical protein [Lachnospiraceae bacterium]
MTQPDKKLFQRSLLILFFDLLGITFSGFFALWIRFDLSIAKIETKYVEEQRRILPILILTLVAVYFLFRLYHSIWRFASVSELTRIVGAYILLVPVILIERRLFTFDLPRSTYFIAYM